MGITDKWYVVCNPIAQGGKMKLRWPEVKKTLEKNGILFDWTFTTHNNHAIEITRSKISEGYRKFIVIGGDGSINEVINGFFTQDEVDYQDLLLALIPLGTANDWARTHKLPRDITKAVKNIVDGHIEKQDIGLVSFEKNGKQESRYFNNVAGMSYDAYVAKYIEDHGNRKMNKLKYIYYVLYCLFMFKLPETKVQSEDLNYCGKAYTINVGICKYNGGGLRLVPQALANDGKFALTVAKELSKLAVIMNMYRFYTGTIGELKKVITVNTGDIMVEQSGDEKVMLEVDGEFMGYAPSKFTLFPSALSFISNSPK